jgi:hypothetical protein
MYVIPRLRCDPGLAPLSVSVALVWGFGMPGCPKTASPPAYLAELLRRVRSAGAEFIPAGRRTAVRRMLRFGAYQPSGRNKPSSEYLLGAALQDSFPMVNPPVDVNNAVSLEWGYPASVFDLDLCGSELLLRRGLRGEAYVFNPAGQTIGLEDLICICRKDGEYWDPCGNPVKDSMATKTRESTKNVAAVIYAPSGDWRADLDEAAARFAQLLRSECQAAETDWLIPQLAWA